jgi:NAD(P)-dependent dehydrogenase (short-subunit alcohol dehydrogenase family)
MSDRRVPRVVVTGAARGIGAALADELRARGTEVITSDVLGGVDYSCDISDETQVDEMFAAIGPITGLVNNAGLLVSRKAATDITVEEFRRMMDVNVLGTFLCARAALRSFASNGGSIVNVASETAFTGSHHFVHYVASKGAVVSLTRALANEWGEFGVRVNCIAPGYTPTPGSTTLGEYDPSRTPLGRVMDPKDLLGTFCYLLSDDSAFVTGQTMLVNGGRYPH